MKHILSLLFAIVFALFSVAGLSVMGAPKAELRQPILNLSENAISRAALWQSIDHILGEYPATVELSYTKDALKIVCSGEVAEVKSGKGDGPYAIFSGCTAEVFLSPDPNSNVYYQFAVSPENKLYQAKCGDCQWKGPVPLKTSTKVEGRTWRAEFIVPFAMLGRKTPEIGEVWRANFVFGKSWSPTADYHDIGQFGTLVFGKPQTALVEVEQFIFRDGKFRLQVNNSDPRAKYIESGKVTRLPLGRTVIVKAMDGEFHKDIRKYDIIILPERQAYIKLSALAPVSNPEINPQLEKFYYAPGEMVNSMECGTFPYGKCQIVVPYCKTLPEIAAPKGKLELKDKVFYAGGKPFYPVVARKNQFLRILPALICGFTQKPFMGAVFEDKIQLNEKSFATAEKDGMPTMFRILYESQLNILKKDANGEIRYEPDQIAVYKKAYEQIKKAHPDAIVSIHADGAARRAERGKLCCDVFEYASWGSSYAPALLPYLEEDLQRLNYDVSGKPVVYWLGSFNASGASRSAEELRAGIYLCLLKGCVGNVIHLGHGGFPKNDTHAWDMIDNVQAEINSFYPDFVKGTPIVPQVRFSSSHTGSVGSNDNAIVSFRQLPDGSGLLICVNPNAFALEDISISSKSAEEWPALTKHRLAPYEVWIQKVPCPTKK